MVLGATVAFDGDDGRVIVGVTEAIRCALVKVNEIVSSKIAARGNFDL